MKKLTLAILIALSGTVFAESSIWKPGLWETKVINQSMDGRDMTAQMASTLAKMSPHQRRQMEAMMRICVSPAMAAMDKPLMNPKGGCKPETVNRSGNKISFEISCTDNGSTSIVKGENTYSGDTVTSRMDTTTTDALGSRHTMHMESQMKYLGSDCQGIQPLDQLVKKAEDTVR
ncbi:MAG: DUF3617 domain-containing protein [Gallionellaceae bacterium]